VAGKFGTPTQRARAALSDDLARLVVPYLRDLGRETVTTDLLNVCAALVAQSDKPAADLAKAAAFIKNYDWRRAKRMMFAAQQGIDPAQVKDPVDKPSQDV
jgi:hypothetical protein